MKHTYDRQINFVGNIRQALQVATTDNETLFKIIMDTFQERDRLRAERLGATAISTTVTHDPRYIVHGHVQPCVVLYSDETTTLIRLDNEDMICETSTIQWSDALTYRCQELLASAGLERGSMVAQRVLPVLSELVRDERVTLNDEGVAVEQPDFVAPVPIDDPVIVEQQRYEAYCERMKARNETIPHIADWRLMGSPTPYVRRTPRK